MALSLKVAELYADLVIKTAAFDATLAKVEERLAGLKDPKLVVAANTTAATAAVARLMAQLRALQAQATVRVNVGGLGRGGGGGGGGGRGGTSPTPGGPAPMDFVGLGKVQFAGLKYQDQLQAAYQKTTAVAEKAAERQAAAASRAYARQVDAASKAYDRQTAAANRAAQQAATQQAREQARAVAVAEKAARQAAAQTARAQAQATATADRAAQQAVAQQVRAQAAAQRAAAGQVAAANRVAQAHARAAAAQAAAAQKGSAAAARQAAALQRAAAQAAAHQRATAAANRAAQQQAAAAQRAANAQVAAANRAANAQARAAARTAAAAKRAAAANVAANVAAVKQFGVGAGQGFGLPFAFSPSMMAGQVSAMGVKRAVTESADMESATNKLGRITGFKGPDLGKLMEGLKGQASSGAVKLDDIIEAANIGGQMGVADKGGVDGLLEFTRVLGQVKSIFDDIPTEKLANGLGRVLNVFGKTTGEAKGLASALSVLSNSSTGGPAELLDITERIAPMAAAIKNVGIPEVLALAAALKDAGIRDEAGGSAIARVLGNIGADPGKFAKLAGQDPGQFAQTYRDGPLKALRMVMDGLNGLDDSVAKMKALKELKLQGTLTSTSLLALAGQLKQVEANTAKAEAEMASGAAIMDGFNGKLGETNSKLTAIGNEFKLLWGEIGDGIKPATDQVLEGFNSMVKGARAAIADLNKLRPDGPSRIGEAIGPFGGIGGAMTGSGLADAIRKVGPNGRPGGEAPVVATIGGGIGGGPAAAAERMAASLKGLATRLGVTVEAAGEKEGFGFGPPEKGGLRFGLRDDGRGLLANGAGQALRGLLTGNLADKLGGANQLSGRNLSYAAAVAAKALEPPKQPDRVYQAGLSGEEGDRRLQEMILNGKKQDEQLRATVALGSKLDDIRTILGRGAGQALNALLGPS